MSEYEPYRIEGLYLGRSKALVDERGWYAKVFDSRAVEAAGGPDLSWADGVQSRSRRGTIRGMHFRRDLRQWKQIRVAHGVIFDVVVDVRPWSASYLQVVTLELDDTDLTQLIVPPGCAHGFQALRDDVDVLFNSSVAIEPALDTGFRFDDETLAIGWPIAQPILNARDAGLVGLTEAAATFEQDFGAVRPV